MQRHILLTPHASLLTLIFLAFTLLTPPAAGAEVKGVKIPDRATVAGKELVLNGAGVRKKFFFSIYVGALYLPSSTTDAAKAIGMPPPKRVLMHFLYDKVSKEKLVHGWEEGFRKNQSKEELEKLRARLDAFNALFTDVKEGDEVVIDFLPDGRTTVSINGSARGSVEGEDFQQALLAVWLGRKPADAGLKEKMLKGGA